MGKWSNLTYIFQMGLKPPTRLFTNKIIWERLVPQGVLSTHFGMEHIWTSLDISTHRRWRPCDRHTSPFVPLVWSLKKRREISEIFTRHLEKVLERHEMKDDFRWFYGFIYMIVVISCRKWPDNYCLVTLNLIVTKCFVVHIEKMRSKNKDLPTTIGHVFGPLNPEILSRPNISGFLLMSRVYTHISLHICFPSVGESIYNQTAI